MLMKQWNSENTSLTPGFVKDELDSNIVKADKDLVISVVVPVFNEQDCIEHFIKKTTKVLKHYYKNYELLLIDDSSTDSTVQLIQNIINTEKNIRLILLSRSYGEEIAITAGLDHAIGDYVVIMTAYRGDPIDLIPDLIRRAQSGYDIVYTTKDEKTGGPLMHRLAARAFFNVNRRLTGLNIQPEATDYRVVSRRVVNSITRLKEHNRFIRMLTAYIGFKSDSIPIEKTEDWATNAKYSYRRKLRLAIDSIVAFSDKPLRYVSLLSLGVSLSALGGAFYVVIQKIREVGLVEGWASLMIVQLLMFWILFLFLAVISEYISRILVESKNRPLYHVREEFGGTRFDIGNIIDVD